MDYNDLNFFREAVSKTLSPVRAKHVLLTEKAAIELAIHYGADVQKASVGALLHDITKEKTVQEQLEICKKYGLVLSPLELIETKTIHQLTGFAVAKNEYLVYDEDILNAVKHHTTARENMSLLEKIIFIADYIEDSRDFKGVEEIRKAAFEDIDKAMLLGLSATMKKIIKKGRTLHLNTVNAYNYLIKIKQEGN